jgi:predicted MPP superfamily phosphohydrolase
VDIGAILTLAGALAAAGIGGYMIFVEPYRIQVREYELSFPSLPSAFDGYLILHLSDLHTTKFGRLERRLMEIIGSRQVDACVVTGDITVEPRASEVFRRICSVIKNKDPIFAILGNAEHKPWLDTDMLREALTFDGLEMLSNSSSRVSRGDDTIAFVGVDDPYSDCADIKAAFEGVQRDEFVVLLTHCPSATPEGLRSGADLVLAGHTHGGQVRLPGMRPLYTHARASKALNDGLYKPEDLHRVLKIDPGHSVLFVNRGVGTSRFHMRLLCPPEVAYITLRRSQQLGPVRR